MQYHNSRRQKIGLLQQFGAKLEDLSSSFFLLLRDRNAFSGMRSGTDAYKNLRVLEATKLELENITDKVLDGEAEYRDYLRLRHLLGKSGNREIHIAWHADFELACFNQREKIFKRIDIISKDCGLEKESSEGLMLIRLLGILEASSDLPQVKEAFKDLSSSMLFPSWASKLIDNSNQ